MRTDRRFVLVHPLVVDATEHIEGASRGPSRPLRGRPVSVVGALPSMSAQRFAIRCFRKPWEESAPAPVFMDRAGHHPPSLEAGDPFGFLTSWHPHLLSPNALAEHHQHTHLAGECTP